MTKKSIVRCLPVLFITVFVAYLVLVVRQKPRVLILHSYNVDYSWVGEVSTGINRVLAGKPYTIRWHYMDTKRHPSKRFKAMAGLSAQRVIDQWQPHVLLAIADNAQELVAMNYIDHDQMAVVYAGVTENPDEYGYEQAKNVTGIQERWPMEIIRKAIEEVFLLENPTGSFKVRHVADDSKTGRIITKAIDEYDWGPCLTVSSVNVNTLDSWQTEIERANREQDLLLFSLYHTLQRSLEEENVVPPEEVMDSTCGQLEIPSLGGWGFFAEQGGMMAIGVSAFEQGEEAAKMVAAIIDEGKSPEQIPPKKSKQFLVYLREASLNKHGVTVPYIFEAFARATDNYFESESP